MKNPGTPYRLEMRADSLSSNEEVSETSYVPQVRLKNSCAVTRTLLSQINKEILKKKNEIKRLRVSVFKLDLEKAEEPEIKLPTSTGSLKKQ